MLHKTRFPFVFARKDPPHRLLEILCWYACGTDDRAVYGHVIAKFSRMGSLPHFLPMVLRARELRYKGYLIVLL